MAVSSLAGKWVFGWIQHALRVVVADFLRSDTEVAEHLVQLLAEVTKGNSAMVREVLFYQHMAVESAHLRDGKDANRAEGAGCYRSTSPCAM